MDKSFDVKTQQVNFLMSLKLNNNSCIIELIDT